MTRTIDGCFADLIVIECSGSVSAAYAGKLLADLGARVIKVEPLSGDPVRRVAPFAHPGSDFGALFLYSNSNKLGVTLDVDTPTGCTVLHRLLERADVVITDGEPASLQRLGLASPEGDWPGLVVASVRPYGCSGPWRDRPGTELDVFHASGEGSLLPGGEGFSLFPARPPVKAGRFLAEYDAGVATAVAIVASLIRRLAGGLGEFIEISQQEAEMSLGRVSHDLVLSGGRTLTRKNRQYDYGGLFRCRDGYMNIRPNEDRHWAALARGISRPELADDPRFATRAARLKNRPEVNALIAEWVAERPWREVYRLLSPLGTPVGVYADAQAILESEQLSSRGAIRPFELEDGTTIPFLAPPYQLSESPFRLELRAPHLGEHTAQVLSTIGIDGRELSELREARVC